MVYRTVSSKNVIAKVFRDLKPGSSDWVTDAVEWLGEVVERVGSYSTMIKKQVTLTSIGNKIHYPCDLESVDYVEYNGCKLPYAGGNLNICNDAVLVYAYQGNYYLTSDTCLQTWEDEVEITLHYTAFPTDEYGYPTIPDNFYYKTACFWYIASRLAMREQIKLKYETCEERFNTYATLAENDCAFPSPEKMARFKDRWCRIVPNVHANFTLMDHHTTWLERAY